MTTNGPILAKFRAALEDVYGSRIERVVLFVSRARGDAHADSDYDVALFLNDLPAPWLEVDRLMDIEEGFRDKTGAERSSTPCLSQPAVGAILRRP